MKIICLSNSFKEGGRCIAGIRINDENQIYRSGAQNRPVWVRPVCNTQHEQIPNRLVSLFKYNDILEFTPDPTYSRNDYQSENLMISSDDIRFVKKTNYWGIIDNLCDNDVFGIIFNSNTRSVPETQIRNLNHSLMLARITDFNVSIKTNQFRQTPQHRLIFTYRGNGYNLPITDPAFLTEYQRNSTILNGKSKIYIVLSLGVVFNGYYYKLVTTILYQHA